MWRVLSIAKDLPDKVIDQFDQINVDECGEITREKLLSIIHEYDGILAGDIIKYDEEVFKQAKKLKVLTRFGIGYDNVDIKTATEYGIVVTNTPGQTAETVAEHSIGLMIAAARNYSMADREVRSGNWVREEVKGYELAHKTLGQIGFGNIGMLIAQKCRLAFDMDVLVYDPYVPEYLIQNLVSGTKTELDVLIENSDIISINIPATEETKNMFGLSEFKKMKETAIIINAGRGGIIVEEDLLQALEDGEILAAGLDVFSSGTDLTENPLLNSEGTILTPHIGGKSIEARERVTRAALKDQMMVFKGENPVFKLND